MSESVVRRTGMRGAGLVHGYHPVGWDSLCWNHGWQRSDAYRSLFNDAYSLVFNPYITKFSIIKKMYYTCCVPSTHCPVHRWLRRRGTRTEQDGRALLVGGRECLRGAAGSD